MRRIYQAFVDLIYIAQDELRHTRRDVGMVIFFLIVPLLYPLLYSYIYSQEVVREVPAVVVDEAHTAQSRDFVRRMDASPDVHIIGYATSLEEAQLAIKERRAYGVVMIPSAFSTRIAQGEQAVINLYCDMSGMLYYKALMLTATEVSLQMNREIKVARLGLSSDREGEVATYPVEYREVGLFNPQGGFASFLLPAVLVLVLQQTLLLGISLSVGTYREHTQGRSLLPEGNVHYGGVLRIVLGRGLCYMLIYLVVACYTLVVVPALFNLVRLADFADLALFVLPYLLASIFFAMAMSVFVRTRESGMLLFVFTSVPLLFLSGISWPEAAMPQGWLYLSKLFPSTLGINGYVKLNSMGASLADVALEFIGLWVQAFVYLLLACWGYSRQGIRRVSA